MRDAFTGPAYYVGTCIHLPGSCLPVEDSPLSQLKYRATCHVAHSWAGCQRQVRSFREHGRSSKQCCQYPSIPGSGHDG